jgi:ATP-dependent helicase/nuclease subunit A
MIEGHPVPRRAARDTPSRHVDAARRLWVEPLCDSPPVELLEAALEEQQREQDEAIRVAYVATTRARDLLIAPVCGDHAIDGWLTVLDPVLYPPHQSRSTSSPAPGCPAFGADSVLDRGRKGQIPPGGPVKPARSVRPERRRLVSGRMPSKQGVS